MGLLEGKVAIVTGAGRGVGRAEAMAMAKAGAEIVVNDLGGDRDGTGAHALVADAVVGEIEAAGGRAVADHSDVGSLEGVDRMVWTALNRFGRLDIMVHNADTGEMVYMDVGHPVGGRPGSVFATGEQIISLSAG